MGLIKYPSGKNNSYKYISELYENEVDNCRKYMPNLLLQKERNMLKIEDYNSKIKQIKQELKNSKNSLITYIRNKLLPINSYYDNALNNKITDNYLKNTKVESLDFFNTVLLNKSCFNLKVYEYLMEINNASEKLIKYCEKESLLNEEKYNYNILLPNYLLNNKSITTVNKNSFVNNISNYISKLKLKHDNYKQLKDRLEYEITYESKKIAADIESFISNFENNKLAIFLFNTDIYSSKILQQEEGLSLLLTYESIIYNYYLCLNSNSKDNNNKLKLKITKYYSLYFKNSYKNIINYLNDSEFYNFVSDRISVSFVFSYYNYLLLLLNYVTIKQFLGYTNKKLKAVIGIYNNIQIQLSNSNDNYYYFNIYYFFYNKKYNNYKKIYLNKLSLLIKNLKFLNKIIKFENFIISENKLENFNISNKHTALKILIKKYNNLLTDYTNSKYNYKQKKQAIVNNINYIITTNKNITKEYNLFAFKDYFYVKLLNISNTQELGLSHILKTGIKIIISKALHILKIDLKDCSMIITNKKNKLVCKLYKIIRYQYSDYNFKIFTAKDVVVFTVNNEYNCMVIKLFLTQI